MTKFEITEENLEHLQRYSFECFDEYKKSQDGNLWFGVEYETTAYDINIYDTDYYGNKPDHMICCVAYKCDGSKEEGFNANWSNGKILWEKKK
tara:strand:+ start:237 stop:515 length:279 start_codon:yes stop_codon:yes gene_type:complete